MLLSPSIAPCEHIIYLYCMTIEQRKLELINWISSIQKEDVINRIEQLRDEPDQEIPDTILDLLEESRSSKPEDGIEHTSARELLGR